jgi:hypothetical protein
MLATIQITIFWLPLWYLKAKINIYKRILLVVLFRCEIWSLIRRCRLRVFENRVLRGIFGPMRGRTDGWKKLLNEELHNLYSSPDIIRVIKSRRVKWVVHVVHVR